jgi:hypothetical protein
MATYFVTATLPRLADGPDGAESVHPLAARAPTTTNAAKMKVFAFIVLYSILVGHS